jgi:uncharacterized phage-associated protein
MSGWTLTNLKLQKLLYIAHMVFVDRTEGQLLISEPFEAWDFGPVLPLLYHRVKMFGDSPIRDVFYDADFIEGTPEARLLLEACRSLAYRSASELVAITHWEGGAWAKHYKKGMRGIAIPTEDILAEYRARWRGA